MRAELALIALVACGAAPPPAALPIATAPPVETPAARIDRALQTRAIPAWPEIETTSAPWSMFPLAKVPTAIKMHDDIWPAHRLFEPDDGPGVIESPAVGRGVLLACGPVQSPAAIGARSEATRERWIEIDLGEPPGASCLERTVRARSSAGAIRYRVTVGAHLVVPEGATVSPAIAEDLAELEKRAPEPKVLVFLGTRHVDAALRDPARRDAELATAIALFERALAEQREPVLTAEANHGLGRALAYRGQLDRAVAPLRSLVCPAREVSLDEERPHTYWEAWGRAHPVPIDLDMKHLAPPSSPNGPRTWAEETTYRSPYAGCTAPIAGVSRDEGANAWRMIGTWHEWHDVAAGPFQHLRAATAYENAIELASSEGSTLPLAALGLGRVYLRLGRYQDAVRVLVTVLDHRRSDASLKTRAAQLVATALGRVDFVGPRPGDAFVARPDVLETEPNPAIAAKKTSIVLERLENPSILPQDRPWLALVYRWTSWDLAAIGMHDLAAQVAEKYLAKFPNDPDAPRLHEELAFHRRVLGRQ